VLRHDKKLLAWIARKAPQVRRLCSVCTGALILAEAGLLDGRRANTHWASCAHLQERHPKVRVESDPIYVQDGSIYTSAGVTAGIDLALALVESDLGAQHARTVARWLVVFLQRPGGQAQFSTHVSAVPAQADEFKDLQAFIAEHPERDLSVNMLAAHVGMSPRNFARRFQAELGISPAKYVRCVRVETARARLEKGNESIESVAERCGFGTEETMRRSFQELVRVAPRNYRQRFARTKTNDARTKTIRRSA
jgi:transcriptional regulator GlxA family with amidase domain